MDSETSDHENDGQHSSPNTTPLFHGYAGFWKRYAAALIDGMILFFTLFLLPFLEFFLVRLLISLGFYIPYIRSVDTACKTVIPVTIVWLYFALFERSSVQATPGKLAVGIKVTDMNGNRISFGRASGRHFAKIISLLVFLVGYIMAAFTSKKQCLHDFAARCLVVNKVAPNTTRTAAISAVGTSMYILALIGLFHFISFAVTQSSNSILAPRGRDIYVAIIGANTEREPLGLKSVWPKVGKKMEEADDIREMTFETSSDYFTVLFDGENYGSENWLPYVNGLAWKSFAGAGTRPKEGAGRLTAENNAWSIAANITDDMPDIIPLLVTRNIDADSLIPREGSLSKQYIRLSEKHKTPFGKKSFMIVRKGGTVFCLRANISLEILYRNTSEEELQEIRKAFKKIKYLAP